MTFKTGWVIHVEVTQCGTCFLSMKQDFGSGIEVFSVSGSATGDFIVPQSGQYAISIYNVGFAEGQVTAIRITAEILQSIEQTQTGYNTVSVTDYSVATVPVYVVLGILTTAVILVLVALAVVFSVLFDQGIISLSVRRRRRRR